MAAYLNIATTNLKSSDIAALKSGSTEIDGEQVDPIIEEFANLDIIDEAGDSISFFDLTATDQTVFLEDWTTANAAEMTPKLNDSITGKDIEEYIKTQNDAFSETMTNIAACDNSKTKSSSLAMAPSELYKAISDNVVRRIKEKSRQKVEMHLAIKQKSGITVVAPPYPDYVDPKSVLSQLQESAHRGDILINLPKQTWLSVYLYHTNPDAIGNYISCGKYPPGHVSIVLQSKGDIQDKDATISSQRGEGNGVMKERISDFWDCEAHLCYVKKKVWKWRGFKSGFYTVHPDVDKVINYAEKQIGKPYCEGWDFVTAKSREACFICTTITWRSFMQDDFNIHRLLARWMPTIAPIDIYVSDHVVQRRFIN